MSSGSDGRLRKFGERLGNLLPGPSRRCMVIALDGIGPNDFLEAVEEGLVPRLREVVGDDGIRTVSSTLPPVAAVAWSNFMTACRPGRHGVFGFTQPQPQYTLRFTDARDLRMPTLWDRAATDGLRSVVVNLPGTYPASRVSGHLVAGYVAPRLDRAVHPGSLEAKLAARGYVVDVDATMAQGDRPRFADHVLGVLERRIETMEWMLDSVRWSLSILAFTEADRLQRMWLRRLGRGDSLERETYRSWFRRVDAFIGRCMTRFPDADIVVVSPYGFVPLTRFVNLDAWLQEHGYLDIDAAGQVSSHSRAFSADLGRVYVASSEVFERGPVARRDVGPLVDELAAGLRDLLNPDTGQPVMSIIRKRRDAYEGVHTHQGPNLTCMPAPGYELKSSRTRPLFSDALFEGTHTLEGFLAGGAVGSGQAPVTLEDAGATVLAKLGLYDDDVDGSSLV